MHHFHYLDGVLHAEGVSLQRIAQEAGTPVYVYSTATLRRHVAVFREAFAGHAVGVFFAVKANGNLSVIRTLAEAGAGCDVVSEGEIRKALAAGVPADRIVFSGVGKTEAELVYALSAGIHQINVETAAELHLLNRLAQSLDRRAPVVLRINPDIGAGGHAKITTGSEANKFGVSLDRAEALYATAGAMSGINMLGLAVHIGSQIFDPAEPRPAFERLVALVLRLRAAGHTVRRLDLGGGLGVRYDACYPFTDGPERVQAYADMVLDVTKGTGLELAFEPGRMIVASAGLLLSRVVTFNERAARTFAVVDAGMNDLVRPAMYDAHHEIWPAAEPAPDTPRKIYDVVGPICESGDTFATSRTLPELSYNDLVAFMTAGAYGASMASTYNQRRLVSEVLVDGDEFSIVRPRQTWDDLIGTDRLAPWLVAR